MDDPSTTAKTVQDLYRPEPGVIPATFRLTTGSHIFGSGMGNAANMLAYERDQEPNGFNDVISGVDPFLLSIIRETNRVYCVHQEPIPAEVCRGLLPYYNEANPYSDADLAAEIHSDRDHFDMWSCHDCSIDLLGLTHRARSSFLRHWRPWRRTRMYTSIMLGQVYTTLEHLNPDDPAHDQVTNLVEATRAWLDNPGTDTKATVAAHCATVTNLGLDDPELDTELREGTASGDPVLLNYATQAGVLAAATAIHSPIKETRYHAAQAFRHVLSTVNDAGDVLTRAHQVFDGFMAETGFQFFPVSEYILSKALRRHQAVVPRPPIEVTMNQNDADRAINEYNEALQAVWDGAGAAPVQDVHVTVGNDG